MPLPMLSCLLYFPLCSIPILPRFCPFSCRFGASPSVSPTCSPYICTLHPYTSSSCIKYPIHYHQCCYFSSAFPLAITLYDICIPSLPINTFTFTYASSAPHLPRINHYPSHFIVLPSRPRICPFVLSYRSKFYMIHSEHVIPVHVPCTCRLPCHCP